MIGKLDTFIKKIVNGRGQLEINSNKKMNHGVGPVISSANIHEMVKQCRKEIQKSEDSGIMPAPNYFEKVAILSRTEQRYENEIAICEMYIDLVNQYATDNQLTDAEMSSKLLPKCAPFVKRIHNAKIMLSNLNK